MKYLVLVTVIVIAGCSGKKSGQPAQTGAATLTFNGCAMGTPLDTLVKRLGIRPTQQTEDELYYSDVTAEGIRWNEITYNFLEGKLARVTATQQSKNLANYRSLYQALTKQYGKPTRDIDSLTIWARRDAELSLQPGSILFAPR